MRKLKIVCVFLSFALVLCGCKQDCPYEKYVSNLQRDIYYGNINGINISATYGFREYPFINDGVAGTRVYGYVFKVDIIPDDIHRSIELESDGKTYAATFETDKVSGEYKAVIEINEYFEKTFNATFICGSEKNSVVFNSILPENCLTYEQTLQTLISEQSSLLNAYSNSKEGRAGAVTRTLSMTMRGAVALVEL